MSWFKPDPPEETYTATFWRLKVYFADPGKHGHEIGIRADERDKIKSWAEEIRNRMGPQITRNPIYTFEINDHYTESVDCSRVERVKVESDTETRRVRDDVVVWDMVL